MAGPLAGSRISGRHGWAAQARGSTQQEFLALLAKNSSHRVDVGMQVAGWLAGELAWRLACSNETNHRREADDDLT